MIELQEFRINQRAEVEVHGEFLEISRGVQVLWPAFLPIPKMRKTTKTIKKLKKSKKINCTRIRWFKIGKRHTGMKSKKKERERLNKIIGNVKSSLLFWNKIKRSNKTEAGVGVEVEMMKTKRVMMKRNGRKNKTISGGCNTIKK